MEYTKLGKTDLTVSRICMGCMGFGDPNIGQHTWTLPEDESREIIKQGLDAGITNCFAWLLTKVDAPVVGATKPHHVEGAVTATKIKLTDEEIAYLEEPYVPHALAGVMAQNGKQKAGNVV